MDSQSHHSQPPRRIRWYVVAGALGVGAIFWLLGQSHSETPLNYTFVVASALLHGYIGLAQAPSWLNELVPMPNGLFYSVFPLGAVLSVLPASELVNLGWLADYPVDWVVAIIAAATAGLSYAYTSIRSNFSVAKRAMLALWLVGGTWYMTNLLFQGAWQVALGFAVMGELAALYWSVVRPRPFLAGLGLAVAFGNRTEIILIAPIILALLVRPDWTGWGNVASTIRQHRAAIARFALAPVVLGVATLIYNHLRFNSITDFGYARIPGVLNEPWYKDGIYSLSAIPENAHQMLWQGWRAVEGFPFSVPTGWGGSILLASPFLLLLVRRPKGDASRITLSWIAIIVLTLALWLHGNPGGWQYSYRYAMILLPWFLVLLVEYLPDNIKWYEFVLWLVSLAMSGYATYLFLWSPYVTP